MDVTRSDTTARLKRIIIGRFDVEITEEAFDDEQPLFGPEPGSLGLDSVEALELALLVEVEFGVEMDESEVVEHFYSVATLSSYIQKCLQDKSRSL